MSYFNKLFGIYKDRASSFCYILGHKFNFQAGKDKPAKKNSLEILNRLIQVNLSTAYMHQKVFPKFKNIHNGRDIVLVASGMTAQYYTPKQDVIHIAVNKSFLMEKIKFDYLFMQDYEAVKDYINKAVSYRNDECKKFFGLTLEYKDSSCNKIIPETYAIKANAYRYRTDWASVENFIPQFAYDISTMPLGCFGSIVFPALQFALWTNPKRLYLVGCDCSNSGYFDDSKKGIEFNSNELLYGWKQFKNFVQRYYPETEIISINPIGLKGIFEDEYTTEFMSTEVYKNANKHCNIPSNDLLEYLKRVRFDKQVKALKAHLKSKKIVIYGAGQLFKLIKQHYDLSNLNIIGIADKKLYPTDGQFLGYQIIPISEIKNVEPDYILVATLNYLSLIENLENEHFKDIQVKILPLVKYRGL